MCILNVYKDLPRKIKYFGSSLIYVVCNIVSIETTTPVVVTRDKDTGSEKILTRREQYRYYSTQRIHLLRFTIVVDTLAQNQGRSLPSQPLSEIFLTLWIVYLVFFLLKVYTCECWARPSTFL